MSDACLIDLLNYWREQVRNGRTRCQVIVDRLSEVARKRGLEVSDAK